MQIYKIEVLYILYMKMNFNLQLQCIFYIDGSLIVFGIEWLMSVYYVCYVLWNVEGNLVDWIKYGGFGNQYLVN